MIALLVPPAIAWYAGAPEPNETRTVVPGVIVCVFWSGVYAPLLMRRPGRRNGQSWGKQLVGIRVIRDDGKPIGFLYALLREGVAKGVFMARA